MNTSDTTKIELYRKMLFIRMVEESIAERYSESKMRTPVHLSIGQEACAAGVSQALDKGDLVMSGHRSHAHYLAKGGNLKKMIAEIYGKETGCSKGRGGSMHMIDLDVGFLGAVPIVGSTIPIAVGVSFANQYKNNNIITVAYFGEGATEEGVFYESVNYALLKNLPILFVCENNLYSVYSPLSVRQPKNRGIKDLASGLGLNSHKADGNNPVEIYEQTTSLLNSIRNKEGPALIELPTYRYREHCGPNFDSHLNYRTEVEYDEWLKKDPIPNFEKTLRTENLIDDDYISNLKNEYTIDIESAFDFAEESSFPSPETLFDHIYSA